MKRLGQCALLLCIPFPCGIFAQDLGSRVRQLEMRGDGRGAAQALEQAVKSSPRDANAAIAYARFLDARRDPRTRQAYESALELASGPQKAELARRLATLDLIAGDRDAAARALEAYRAAGGAGLAVPAAPASPAGQQGTIEVPGPLRSFARMAALSPDLAPEDLIGALARNVITNGYQATSGSESLDATEYLKLVIRYLSQARELDRLAGEARILRIDNCDSTQTGQLLKILGFRMRGGCGSEVVLETVNATRAFLTMDSGFPLADLEQALRTNRPFVYDYKPTRIPVMYSSEYWLSSKEKQSGEFIDAFLTDPALCRLYLGLSKIDPETADALRKALPVQRIRAFAHVFDFFGGMFRLKDGKAVVPGGQRSAAAWTELTGTSPDAGAEFFESLVAKDDAWMASYFDALSRIEGPVADYLTEPSRLKRNYAALRGRITSPGPARPVFRANTDLMLLTTRLRLDSDGKPHIPGGVEVWKNLFLTHPNGKYDGKLTKSSAGWKDPDDVIEALFGLSRKAVENEPLKIFLALSDMDRKRSTPLEGATVSRLMRDFRLYGAQYPVLNEAPTVSDKTIIAFLDTAAAINDVADNGVKSDSAGLMQALTGLWQVFCRHKLITPKDADATLAELIAPFGKGRSGRDLFDAGRSGALLLLKTAGTQPGVSPQDRMMELLAGAAHTEDQDSLSLLVGDMSRIFESQRLISLKTLFDLADHLESVSRGEKLNTALVNRLASRVSDLNLPRASLSAQEKNAFSFGYWTEKHIDTERKLNLRALIDRAAGSPDRLKDIRGLLTPLLRDTLVGLLYVHYAPPGAQVIITNPLFVRSHDFVGIQGTRQTWKSTEVLGSGWPSSAGGRLVGSLATLPYALAEAEQNFLIPTREQALIWGDLVPQLLVSSKVNRWWNVTPDQLHFVSVQMRLGEAVLAEGALAPEARVKALELLGRQADPLRVRKCSVQLAQGNVQGALRFVTPSELYQLGAVARDEHVDAASGLQSELNAIAAGGADRFTPAVLSEAFGTPKPTLANSYRPELLHLRLFPTLMGYSSRLMAESWESNNLYYAGLADELYLAPSQLNLLVPDWTQKGIEQIFATHLEDWPALLQSIRVTGDRIRSSERKLRGLEAAASLE
jgi:hypothetical protein